MTKNQVTQLIKDDYPFALVHVLVLHASSKEKHLLFSEIECYPHDFYSAPETPQEGYISQVKSGYRLHYYRLKAPISQAIEWYHTCNSSTTIDISQLCSQNQENQPSKNEYQCGQMTQVVEWGEFISSNKLPFIAQQWNVVRAHHYIPSTINKVVEDFFIKYKNDKNGVLWCEEVLSWPISKYKSFWGTINLLLPNPILRSFNGKLSDKEKHEKILYTAIPRHYKDTNQEISLNNLKLYHIEKHFYGYHKIIVKPLKPTMVIKQSKKIDQSAYIISCSKRGILDYHEPCSFARKILLSQYISTPEKIFFKDEQTKHERIVNRTKHELVSEHTLGTVEQNALANWRMQLIQDEELIKKEKAQEIWLDNKDYATMYIRALFEKAKERVIIVDPYFSTNELFNFISAIPNKNVEVTIMTSRNAFIDLEKQDTTKPIYNHKTVQSLIVSQTAFVKNWGEINIKVMTKKSIIHDRFLLIDDKVWLSGNSLNNIGDKASMLVLLDNYDMVYEKILLALAHRDTNDLSELAKKVK